MRVDRRVATVDSDRHSDFAWEIAPRKPTKVSSTDATNGRFPCCLSFFATPSNHSLPAVHLLHRVSKTRARLT